MANIMEEKILDILDDNGYNRDYMEARDAAKEIINHFTKFIEWRYKWCENGIYIGNGKTLFTIEDTYKQWIDNVINK